MTIDEWPADVMSDRTVECFDKVAYLVCVAICIELVLFKFLPDIGTAVIQGSSSTLTDFGVFEQTYLLPDSVHHARFLGNELLYHLARLIATVTNSSDVRLYPLRIAAGILTPVYAFTGALPVLSGTAGYNWRAFLIPYALAVIMGLYVFYPGDMPALAFLSIGLFLLLQQRMAPALGLMLVVGLFRESSFHMVWFVAAWAMCTDRQPLIRRLCWVATFAAAFAAEYRGVRIWFPGPISASGGVVLDPKQILLGSGLISLTTLCSLALAALFPILCWTSIRPLQRTTWQARFFLLNCAAFPFWIVFYRMFSGNISEFRMLLPVVLPCLYGISYGSWVRQVRSCDAAPVPVPSGQ